VLLPSVEQGGGVLCLPSAAMGVAPHTLPGPVSQLKRRLCGAPVSSVLLLGAALTACVLVVGELGWGLRNLSTENLAFSSLRQALAPSRRAAAQAPKKVRAGGIVPWAAGWGCGRVSGEEGGGAEGLPMS
jgi:hypothetical protein